MVKRNFIAVARALLVAALVAVLVRIVVTFLAVLLFGTDFGPTWGYAATNAVSFFGTLVALFYIYIVED